MIDTRGAVLLALAVAVLVGYFAWQHGNRRGRIWALKLVLRELAALTARASTGDAAAAVNVEGVRYIGNRLVERANDDDGQPLLSRGRGSGHH